MGTTGVVKPAATLQLRFVRGLIAGNDDRWQRNTARRGAR